MIVKKIMTVMFYTLTVCIILLSAFTFRSQVTTNSMDPTLEVGSQLLVVKGKNVTRGDIIVFQSDELEKTLVKRLIGLEGDKISIENGTVKVNGKAIKENYVSSYYDYTGEFTVPAGSIFLLGDNRKESYDSRFWMNPFIPIEKVKGKVVIKILPEFKIMDS
jgi:signal peptidase I